MKKLHILPHEWVVVCDGRKALILENVGDDRFPNLRCREEHDHPDPPTHELGTSGPGRAGCISRRASRVAPWNRPICTTSRSSGSSAGWRTTWMQR